MLAASAAIATGATATSTCRIDLRSPRYAPSASPAAASTAMPTAVAIERRIHVFMSSPPARRSRALRVGDRAGCMGRIERGPLDADGAGELVPARVVEVRPHGA